MPTLLVNAKAVAGRTGVGLKVVDVVGVVIDEVGVAGVLAGVVIDVVGEVVVAVVDAAGTSVDTEALLASAAALLVVLPPPPQATSSVASREVTQQLKISFMARLWFRAD